MLFEATIYRSIRRVVTKFDNCDTRNGIGCDEYGRDLAVKIATFTIYSLAACVGAAISIAQIVVDVAFIGADNSTVNHADAVAVTGAKRRAARATVACADAAVVGC